MCSVEKALLGIGFSFIWNNNTLPYSVLFVQPSLAITVILHEFNWGVYLKPIFPL